MKTGIQNIVLPTLFEKAASIFDAKTKTGWVCVECMSRGLYYQKYYCLVDGKCQSINDKPSFIETWTQDNNLIIQTKWYENDLVHRIGGPANLIYNFSTDYLYSFYSLHDITLKSEEYWDHPLVNEYKLKKIIEL